MDNFIPLDSMRIASPCSADLDTMQGDGRTRFCSTCARNVYNLSDMSRARAQALVNEKEGKLCVQYLQRADGTMLIDDCPVMLRPARSGALRTWRAVAAAAIALASLCSGLLMQPGEAAPKRHGVTTHRVKKANKRLHKRRVVHRRPARKPPKMPTQLMTGIVAPLPTDAIPARTPIVMHPDRAPGGMKSVVPGQSRTRVIHVPQAGEAPPAEATMDKPSAPVPSPQAAPKVPPLQRLGDVAMAVPASASGRA